MTEIEVQRYDKDGFAESDGCYYMHADVAPLLAELATLRDFRDRAAMVVFDQLSEIVGLRARLAELEERTRRRDAATEPPPEGEWVLGLTKDGGFVEVISRDTDGEIVDLDGERQRITAWWPRPEVANG